AESPGAYGGQVPVDDAQRARRILVDAVHALVLPENSSVHGDRLHRWIWIAQGSGCKMARDRNRTVRTGGGFIVVEYSHRDICTRHMEQVGTEARDSAVVP